MKDAIEYMQRNASTIGNISGAESMSAIFKITLTLILTEGMTFYFHLDGPLFPCLKTNVYFLVRVSVSWIHRRGT